MQFENDWLELIKGIKFKKLKNKFQTNCTKTSSIKKSDFFFSRNIYETDKSTYSKLLTDNISKHTNKTYKQTKHNIYNTINIEAKIIANNYGVSQRLDCLTKSNAFISLKYHKSNFSSNPKCRLINPAKSEIGKLINTFLKNSSKVRDLSRVNQWQETSTVKNWFKNINDKKKCIFTQFDFEELYPSKELLLKAIMYAKTLVNISDVEIKIIMH